MRILKTYKSTCADGPGVRYAIYVAGCRHECDGCHNPESWPFDQGEPLTQEKIDQILSEIRENPMLDGITISGGDPFFHPEDLYNLLHQLWYLKKDIWVYTGYTVREILDSRDLYKILCLNLIDTLVDGRYEKDLRETSSFRGSSNQKFVKAKEIFLD